MCVIWLELCFPPWLVGLVGWLSGEILQVLSLSLHLLHNIIVFTFASISTLTIITSAFSLMSCSDVCTGTHAKYLECLLCTLCYMHCVMMCTKLKSLSTQYHANHSVYHDTTITFKRLILMTLYRDVLYNIIICRAFIHPWTLLPASSWWVEAMTWWASIEMLIMLHSFSTHALQCGSMQTYWHKVC